jgi:TRAP-type transport system periplasmic protein
VAMPMGDRCDAVSQGVVDGTSAVYEALKDWKLGEVIGRATENKVACVAAWIAVMNKNKWNSIPPDIQKKFELINLERSDRQGTLWDRIDQEGKEFSLNRGNRVITLSAEENARWAVRVRPLFDDYAAKMRGKNLPGSEALRFAREYLKKQAGQ